jgi:hypothetical protein
MSEKVYFTYIDDSDVERERRFVCRFHFVGWWAFSLGFHISVKHPNIELHVPFGLFKIGWDLFYKEEQDG